MSDSTRISLTRHLASRGKYCKDTRQLHDSAGTIHYSVPDRSSSKLNFRQDQVEKHLTEVLDSQGNI